MTPLRKNKSTGERISGAFRLFRRQLDRGYFYGFRLSLDSELRTLPAALRRRT
jgi:hypothetical protein